MKKLTYKSLLEPLLTKYKATSYDSSHSFPSVVDLHTKKDYPNPTFVLDIASVVSQYQLWNKYLPRVRPFYAVKAGFIPAIIETLAALGCGFDCASKGEFTTVKGYGVDSKNIIFANTIKSPDHILAAKGYGIDHMTFDNIEELTKIKKHFPEANLILRIKSHNKKHAHSVNTKFGCPLDEVTMLLEKAVEYNLNVVGVSFHVGYKCTVPEAYYYTLEETRKILNQGRKMGLKMNIIDIGGGYPGFDGDVSIKFEEDAMMINKGLDEFFSDLDDVTFISEPGRYFAAKCASLVVSVTGKRKILSKETDFKFNYYLNDGIFGSFSAWKYGDDFPEMILPRRGTQFKSKLFGPTCDSQDVLIEEIDVPELEIDDKIIFNNWGAYALGFSTRFNGFGEFDFDHIFCDSSLLSEDDNNF